MMQLVLRTGELMIDSCCGLWLYDSEWIWIFISSTYKQMSTASVCKPNKWAFSRFLKYTASLAAYKQLGSLLQTDKLATLN